MAPKKKSMFEAQDVDREIVIDTTEVEEVLNDPNQTESDSPQTKESEEETHESTGWIVTDYVHIYERVTNGGKRLGVLRRGAEVKVLSETHNWVEIQSVDRPDIRGFVRPGSIEQG